MKHVLLCAQAFCRGAKEATVAIWSARHGTKKKRKYAPRPNRILSAAKTATRISLEEELREVSKRYPMVTITAYDQNSVCQCIIGPSIAEEK